MDELTEYYVSLVEHLHASADVEGSVITYEYLSYILELLSDAGEFEDFSIIEDGIDGAGRWAFDGYSYDENNFCLSLFISILDTAEEPKRLLKADIESAIKKLSKFAVRAISGNLMDYFEPTSSCYLAAKFIRDSWPEIARVKLVVLSNRPLAERASVPEFDDLDGRPCTVDLWDLRRIYKLESSRREREEMVVDFSEAPLPCIVSSRPEGGDGGLSVLTVFPAQLLVDLYGKWGSRLLEQNVRSFLQHRGKVNKGIRNTIIHDPSNFFAFNNGLTATAKAAVVTDGENGQFIEKIEDLQIVNGGQTTASIYSAALRDKADMAGISIQVKLTVLPDEDPSSLVAKIARFANSQNKVSEADLFSNHPFHIRLEEISRRIWVPVKAGQAAQTHWFYERARGQYLDAQAYLTPAKKKQFQKINPRSQLLTKTDVAKVMNSWDELPHEVSKGAQKNFAVFADLVDGQWESDDTKFNEFFFRKLVSRASIFRVLERAILKEPWYAGYRANLVTYAIARLSHEISKKREELDVDAIWRGQVIPDILTRRLLQLARSVNELLLDENRPVGNPSELAKRKVFWESVKQIECRTDDLGAVLITHEAAQDSEKEARKTQSVDKGIQAQSDVLATPAHVWTRLEELLMEEGEATPSLMGILKVAKSPTRFPSEKQANVLFKLKEKYKDFLQS